MVKLALAVGRGSELGNERATVSVDARASELAFAQLGDLALLYLHVQGVILNFVGQGRVSAVGATETGRRIVTIAPYTTFAVPVSGDVERTTPGAQRALMLEDERFHKILALSVPAKTADAEEMAGAFDPTPTEATYNAIRDQVLRAWRRRCAFTGAVTGRGPDPSIVAIRPRDQGGPLHVRNYIPMVRELEGPWRAGHFSVGEDFRILGDLYRLAPEAQDSMVALFKMLLPSNEKNWPDPDLLAWHRANVFGRS